jgi:hypothetical protein
MSEKENHYECCIFLIIIFSLLLAVSLGGLYYGISKNNHLYILAGPIVSLISLAVICETIRRLVIGQKRFTKEEKENKNENENS